MRTQSETPSPTPQRSPLQRYHSFDSLRATTMLLPASLAYVGLPAVLKFSLVLSATAAITLVTYHYWVRSTFIGETLNGRRYPREMPHYELSAPVQQGHGS